MVFFVSISLNKPWRQPDIVYQVKEKSDKMFNKTNQINA